MLEARMSWAALVFTTVGRCALCEASRCRHERAPAREHEVLITIEEGSVGGLRAMCAASRHGRHARPRLEDPAMCCPTLLEHDTPNAQYEEAGSTHAISPRPHSAPSKSPAPNAPRTAKQI